MAWEDFERNGVKGMIGDRPIDEFSLALKRIATAYEDRLSRKPTVVELLYALETVVGTSPSHYVSDPAGLALGEIVVQRDYSEQDQWLDKTQYEGVYTEATLPGYHLVSRRASNGYPEVEVIKIPTLEVREGTLVCEYELLTNSMTDQMAKSLIVSVLLDEYCGRYYEDKVNGIDFINVNSNGHGAVP